MKAPGKRRRWPVLTRPLLPPRGIFASTRLLFDHGLSASIKETLLELMALTWGSDSHVTPPLSYPLLEHLTGKDARTLRGHFAALRTYHAALRLQRADGGYFIVWLAPWLFNNALEPEAARSGGKANEDFSRPVTGNFLPEPDHDFSLRKKKN